MKSPANYAEWCDLFDEIVQNVRDDAYIAAVSGGTVSWTSGVAERFVRSAAEMIRQRVDHAQDVYQRQMKNSRGMANQISGALTTLQREYRYVYQLACALPIPPEHRNEISKMVQDQADRTQQSLEDSARADRTGHLTALVRNARVNKLT